MISCSNCGRENEDHFNFCLGCGANLKAQQVQAKGDRICPNCGASVPMNHVFCGQCGTRLGDDATPDSSAVPDKVSAKEIAEPTPEPPSTKAKLVIINPDGSTGQTIALDQGRNVFGRTHGPTVFREDPFLSPEHVDFRLEEDRLEARDLDSLNGIYVRIVEPTEIVHLDRIRIGRQVLAFQVLKECKAYVEMTGDTTKALGGPCEQAWGRLVRVSHPERNSQAFLLTRPEEIIGRERGSIMFRDDGFVSSRHARITVSGGRSYIEDLRSSNGTFLKVRKSYTVRDGDLLLMGQQPLRAYLG